MTERRIDGFFYGLFMDVDVLRNSGVAPADPRHAHVDHFALRIGERATLVPSWRSFIRNADRAYTFGVRPFMWGSRLGSIPCRGSSGHHQGRRRRSASKCSAVVALGNSANRYEMYA
jgi:hypothetical protein